MTKCEQMKDADTFGYSTSQPMNCRRNLGRRQVFGKSDSSNHRLLATKQCIVAK
jgi:hypothetical protein